MNDEIFMDQMRQKYNDQYLIYMAVQNNPKISYKDLAARFEIPVGTVKSRLSRARERVVKWERSKEKEKAPA